MTDAVLHAGMLVAIIIIVTVVMLMCIAVVAVTIFLWRRKSRNSEEINSCVCSVYAI